MLRKATSEALITSSKYLLHRRGLSLMVIKGSRITIKPLMLEDVYSMRNWGKHDNPLIGDYNFPNMSDKEIVRWYKCKVIWWKNKYFGIFNEENRFIGYMGIKDIKFFRRESTLGLVFDPNYVSKRYGTETLRTFLNYYFTEMNMKRMYLEVAEFNNRAHKLYKNMGFIQDGYYLDYFHDQKMDLNNPFYLEEQSSFVIDDKKIYNYIYKMKLDKEDFFEANRS